MLSIQQNQRVECLWCNKNTPLCISGNLGYIHGLVIRLFLSQLEDIYLISLDKSATNLWHKDNKKSLRKLRRL